MKNVPNTSIITTHPRDSWEWGYIYANVLKDFDKADPLSILAYQYDLVCNGYEISSGAIRNHLPDLMYKVFSKVGYSK